MNQSSLNAQVLVTVEVGNGDGENNEAIEDQMLEIAKEREKFFSLSPNTKKPTAISLKFIT